jgi:phage terminase large subunit
MSDITKVKFPKIFKELDKPHRYKVMYGGRGSAKSWTVARKLLIKGVEKKIRILCTRELQKSIKQSVHKLLADQIDAMGLNGFYEVQQQGIFGKNGTEFIFMGVKHNPYEIKSTEGIEICWIEEAESLTEQSWDIIDPTIRAENSEIWITYNTRFKFDYLHQKFVINKPPTNSLVIRVNHQDNPYFPKVLKLQMEEMKAKDYEKYLHIWEGELKMLAEGAIFGSQVIQTKKDKRLLNIPVIKSAVVDTFWDIGRSDHTAIWFMQRVGKEYRFIDFFMGRLEEVEYYAKALRKLDYNYGRHYLPHDADHDRLGMKRNIKEQFMDLGVKPITIVPRIKVKQTAIELTRNIFPECWFHQGTDERGQRMEKGWEALCNYRYKYNDDDDVYQKSPHHDWASNPADAFMQFAQGYNENKFDTTQPIIMNNSFNIF